MYLKSVHCCECQAAASSGTCQPSIVALGHAGNLIPLLPQGQGAFGKVYKALRGGVQDVAVKQLHHTEDGQLEHFIEVTALCEHHAPGQTFNSKTIS
jgi:hypothetical protein